MKRPVPGHYCSNKRYEPRSKLGRILANGSKPWKIPSFADLPSIPAKHWTKDIGFHPYLRDEDTLSRPWVVPGTPGLEHRIGGLEKDYDSGNFSYLAANHDRMARVRATKIARIADDLEPIRAMGSPDADVLVVGWGSTFGSIEAAVRDLAEEGVPVAHAHLRWLNPMPPGLGELLGRYRRIIVPELNLGQLVRLLRDRFLIDAIPINRVEGRPFKAGELSIDVKLIGRRDYLLDVLIAGVAQYSKTYNIDSLLIRIKTYLIDSLLIGRKTHDIDVLIGLSVQYNKTYSIDSLLQFINSAGSRVTQVTTLISGSDTSERRVNQVTPLIAGSDTSERRVAQVVVLVAGKKILEPDPEPSPSRTISIPAVYEYVNYFS